MLTLFLACAQHDLIMFWGSPKHGLRKCLACAFKSCLACDLEFLLLVFVQYTINIFSCKGKSQQNFWVCMKSFYNYFSICKSYIFWSSVRTHLPPKVDGMGNTYANFGFLPLLLRHELMNNMNQLDFNDFLEKKILHR